MKRISRERILKLVRYLTFHGEKRKKTAPMNENGGIQSTIIESFPGKDEERYHVLFTFATDALCTYVNHHIAMANPQLCQLLGADQPSQLIGKSIFEIVAPEFHGALRERLDTVLRGHPVPPLEEKFVRLDGSTVDVEAHGVALKVNGETEVLVLSHDITERKRTEQALKTTIDQLRSLMQHVEVIREEERKNVSREVHDELGTSLSAIQFELFKLRDSYSQGELEFRVELESIVESIDNLIQMVQDISANLRPGVLDHFGLLAAIEWEAERFRKRANVECSLDLPGSEPEIDTDYSVTLFRILQELLTDVGRHAEAHHIEISLIADIDEFVMMVKDDGIGIPENKLNDTNSLGLIGIRERLYPFGGTCSIKCPPEGGTEINIKIPKRQTGLQA